MHDSVTGYLPREQEAGASGDSKELRATCRRQADVIATLTRVNRSLLTGLYSLEEQNAELRAETDRVHGRGGDLPATAAERADPYVFRLPCDAQAPKAARVAVTRFLGDRVPPALLHRSRLLASELATICVQHSVTSSGKALILRVRHSEAGVRLDVRVPGDDGAVTAEHPVIDGAGSFALQMVHRLCDRWAVEGRGAGGIRLWGDLAPAIGAADR